MLNLIEALAFSGERPIARSTCDGSGCPDVQAEPVEAQMVMHVQRLDPCVRLDELIGGGGAVERPEDDKTEGKRRQAEEEGDNPAGGGAEPRKAGEREGTRPGNEDDTGKQRE